MTNQTLEKVDHAAIKTNRLSIISCGVPANILDLPILTAVVAFGLGMGSALKIPAFGLLSRHLLKPFGWMKSDGLDDNPEPHRFAQFFGFIVNDRWFNFAFI